MCTLSCHGDYMHKTIHSEVWKKWTPPHVLHSGLVHCLQFLNSYTLQ